MSDEKTGIPSSGVNTGGGAFVGGSVNTGGGKFVGRDDLGTTLAQGATREDFAKLLEEFRAALAQAPLPERQARVIEGDVKTVQVEVAEAKPDSAIIQSRIEGITGILGKIGGATVTAGGTLDKLVALGTKLGELAGRLFGS